MIIIILIYFLYISYIFENIIVNQMTNMCFSLKLHKSSHALRYVAIRKKLMTVRNLWDYHSGYAADFGGFLGCYCLLTGEYLQCSEGYFWFCLQGQIFKIPLECLVLKMEALRLSEMSSYIYQPRRFVIREGLNLQTNRLLVGRIAKKQNPRYKLKAFELPLY